METFWLLGHVEFDNMQRSSPLLVEEIFESVYEPEFLQIIWRQFRRLKEFLKLKKLANRLNFKKYCRIYEILVLLSVGNILVLMYFDVWLHVRNLMEKGNYELNKCCKCKSFEV